MFSSGSLIIFVVCFIVGLWVQARLRRKFKKYGQIPLSAGLSGKEIAERMLSDEGIDDVQITCVAGKLTDHYNPSAKTVNLSEEVYSGRSISSAAVAAHECGHAIQHARSYPLLSLRSNLVPLQNISSRLMNFLFIAMFLGAWGMPGLFSYHTALLIIIGCYTIFTLFSFVTLPVEFDASRQALSWLRVQGISNSEEELMIQDALSAAAQTYIVAALSSLAMLLHYVMLFLGGNRE
ncbi:MAG: zinc metallopeptidase [Cytophagales bacterium]|nr:zinc metallopeptidase [Cytophagales bacterium]